MENPLSVVSHRVTQLEQRYNGNNPQVCVPPLGGSQTPVYVCHRNLQNTGSQPIPDNAPGYVRCDTRTGAFIMALAANHEQF